ncbi:hypothetical protein ACFL2H_09610 [Planctomycetota bacterium]
MKKSRQYTNLSAAEVREALLGKGDDESQLPGERTIRGILNRMNYRLKRIQKGKPLKKTEDTDAIFANVHSAREHYRDDPEILEISVDTKTKVSLGEYALGEKTRTELPLAVAVPICFGIGPNAAVRSRGRVTWNGASTAIVPCC